MIYQKHKIITGFPCNNGEMYMIMTEDFGNLTTTSKKQFDQVMKDGYIELAHDEQYDV